MIIEDFTHVLPEDKPIRRKQTIQLNNAVYDLEKANERWQHVKQLNTKVAQIEKQARERYRSLLCKLD